ncbi:MAG: B12-binding domain-containing radical SAM protein [Acidimicrobiaceae bacterium]|nr:B12-binding domain-containing radical SAM protein [Acidimicrobiaceae bacterium]|tara:strand:- start:19426 stop:21375 length:1950 start_codon:yes stop_codon:yes gene_type:complete
MSSVWETLEKFLDNVEKPARYIGLEHGAQRPPHLESNISWLLTYPDVYEVGLPNQGLQILYEILNESPIAEAERAYAPWVDLERIMRSELIPLFSVDTHRPASEFDVIAFNLSSELVYTNLINCIDLAGVPIKSSERTEEHPLIGAGGHCVYNPEPLANIVDFFALGDGEEVITDITKVMHEFKSLESNSQDRRDLLHQLSKIEGVYVPSMYEATYNNEGVQVLEPLFDDVPKLIEKRTIVDLEDWPYPKEQLVPITEVVHDRLNVEVFRGCTRGCRFCQAGMITRPVRERPDQQVRTMLQAGLKRTGYDEAALTSLSTADYSGIREVVEETVADPVNCGQVSISLPSLRVDAFTVDIAASIQNARRTGLTFAPEAGTWRLRQVINKLITEEDLYGAVESAFSQGWKRMKLYFLIGLPTETDEDTLGIARLAANCVKIGKRYTNAASVTVSVGGFVPKPFTPFQWFGQNTVEELDRKVWLLKDEVKKTKGIKLKWHDPKATLVEGVLSRGDRRLGDVLQAVWSSGGVFQEWSEHFNLDLWMSGLEEYGLSHEWFAYRHRDAAEPLPWDHLDAGLYKDFLWQEWRDALEEKGLEDCRWIPCYDCGACTGYGLDHIVASTSPPVGGSQGTWQDLENGNFAPQLLQINSKAK